MATQYSLSLIVPVFNEEEVIERSIKNKIAVLEKWGNSCELILVDDGSTDATATVLERVLAQYNGPITIAGLRSEINEGFGGAVKKGLDRVKGENILCLPVDLDIDNAELSEILQLLKTCPVVACYRLSKPGNSFLSITGSAIYRGLVKFLFGLKMQDVNWVHAYRADVFGAGGIIPRNKKMFFLAEVLIKCKWKGFSIAEMNVEPQLRTNRQGYSQTFSAFFTVMLDLLKFIVKRVIKGKRSDL